MTWKERRIITLLLTVLGILFAILLIVLGIRYRENRPSATDTDFTDPAAAGTPLADPESFRSLQYFNGTVTLSFHVDEEGEWIWTDTPDFPLDNTNLKAILDILSNLHFQQTITSPDTMESYELNNPKGSLTVSDNQGKTQTLTFGKTTSDGTSRYLLLNHEESTVYIMDDMIYQYMQTPIYDMMLLPEFPDLSEGNLRSITLSFPAPESASGSESGEDEPAAPPPPIELTASRSDGSTQAALWFCGSDNVTSSTSIQELLADLESMSISKCVDYHPSDEAASICGFDAPEITLTVEYGADASTVLEIGGESMDGAGRYARLDGESTIYLISGDKLDGLFKVAAQEFERS